MLRKAGRTSCNDSALTVRAGVSSGLRLSGPEDYLQAVLSTQRASLIGYWPMDEASGTTAIDYSRVSGNGTYGGTLSLGQTGIGDGRTALKNTAGALGFYSAAYAAAFNGSEGTSSIWLKVENANHWTDNVDEYIYSVFATNGQIRLRKYPTANLLRFTYLAGGVTETLDVSRYETRWINIVMTWSKAAELAALYINGSFVASSATLGAWSGTLSSGLNCFGALRNDNFANPFKGYIAHGALWSKALTGPEIKLLHDRAVPTVGVFCLGDSKTGASYPWYRFAMDAMASDNQAFEERPVRYYTAGWKVSDLAAYVTANLSSEWAIAQRAWINIGANDLSAGTSEASFKSDLISIVDSIRAKYNCEIYIAKPWRRGYDTEGLLMADWIDSVIALYDSGVRAGPDENVWLKSDDDGATYTIDGVHYNVAGTAEAAVQWVAVNS